MAGKRKFKVGDRVRIIAKLVSFSEFVGKLGVVNKIYNHNRALINTNDIRKPKVVYVVKLRDNTLIHCYAGDLELVSNTNDYSEKSVKSTITDDQLSRMNTELKELADRKSKLSKFIDGPGFRSVDDNSKLELKVQLNAMEIYYSVLSSRYDRLIKSNSKSNKVLYMD